MKFNKEKLIICSHNQFGYLTDTFQYCKLLKNKYDIIYICFDQNKEKINLDGIKNIYIKKNNNMILDYLNLNKNLIIESYKNKVNKIFLVYNPLSFICKFFLFKKKIILDIRTGSVEKNKSARKKANRRIWINSLFFKEKTIISEGLANKLNIKKFEILPLGAEKLKNENIELNKKSIKLIYIGILSGRNIIQSIKGFELFSEKYSDIDCEYNIIGFYNDNDNEEKNFFKSISKNKKINYLGPKKHDEIYKYLNEANIGVSYIPITEYYNYQPPTKTYEYLMNGLITLATATDENKKIIKSENGVLCEDNAKSFSESLEKIYKNLDSYDSKKIIKSVEKNTWQEIVKNILEPILER